MAATLRRRITCLLYTSDAARAWTVELMKLLHEGRGLITAEELGWNPPSYDVFKDLMASRRESLQDLLGLNLTPHLPF